MELIGILNVTPDSFSDGGKWLNSSSAINQAENLLKDGASIIEIGGDSTRPGSKCVGEEEEWRRISRVVSEVSKFSKVSIDTHHASVARKALDEGAFMINDIFGGRDRELLKVVKEFDSPIVLMASRLSSPHDFEKSFEEPIVEGILSFFHDAIFRANEAGLKDNQIILDTGMGAFISDDAQDSWRVLESYNKFCIGYSLLLGVSRKGFLKKQNEKDITDRDLASVYAAMDVYEKTNLKEPKFLRVHNVSVHRGTLWKSL